jgi:hypothetical protein
VAAAAGCFYLIVACFAPAITVAEGVFIATLFVTYFFFLENTLVKIVSYQ